MDEKSKPDQRSDNEKIEEEAEKLLREFYGIPAHPPAHPFNRIRHLLDECIQMDRLGTRKPR